jgi:hypothetical protein
MAALRPTELQIILSATRDIEKVQQISQQYPRQQQEQVAIQFQKEIEARKRKTQEADKAEHKKVRTIEDGDQKRRSLKQTNIPQAPQDGDEPPPVNDDGHTIDFLV